MRGAGGRLVRAPRNANVVACMSFAPKRTSARVDLARGRPGQRGPPTAEVDAPTVRGSDARSRYCANLSRVTVRRRAQKSRTKLRARMCGVAIAVLFATAASPAGAASPVAERDISEALDVESDRCLDYAVLAPSVSAWLKRDRLDARIRVVVRYEGDAISYAFFLGDAFVGKRWFRDLAHACPDVVQTLSLAIAVAIEANFLSAPLDASPEPPASPERESPPPRAEAKRSERAQPRAPREEAPRWRLAAGPLFMWNVLPKPTLGGVASADTAWSRSLETRMSFLVATPVDIALPVGRAEAQLFAFRADVCIAIAISAATARACGGFATGLVTSNTTGLLDDRSRLFPWSAVAGRIDGRVPLKRWGARPAEWTAGAFAAVDALVAVRRPQFLVDYEHGGAIDRVDFPVLGVAPSAGIFFELP